MPTKTLVRLAGAAGLVALLGAGCPQTVSGPPSPLRPFQPVASNQGFGKLPKLALPHEQAGAPNAPSAVADGAAGSAMPSRGMMEAPSPMIARPIPAPYPRPKPVTVEYMLEAPMPTWGTTGDVLQVRSSLPDTFLLSSLGTTLGLPSQLFGGNTSLLSISAQWRDGDSYQWSYDASSRGLSFWKEQSTKLPDWKTFPEFKQDEIIAVAKSFLEAHGFASVAAQTPEILQWPQIMPLLGKPLPASAERADMPCIMMEGAPGGAGGVSAGSATVAPSKPMMAPDSVSVMPYPYPCGWWPQEVTVVYPAMRDGRAVADAWGNPLQAASVGINLLTKQASNGSVQLDQAVDRSSYPLIDQDTAKRRLQSGGRNPIWPWGTEGKNIKVHITSIGLSWMRADSWKDNKQTTYFLPAILATGTVDRGIRGQQDTEEYRTILPILQDDVFEPDGDTGQVPLPGPMMKGGVR